MIIQNVKKANRWVKITMDLRDEHRYLKKIVQRYQGQLERPVFNCEKMNMFHLDQGNYAKI